MLLLDDQKHKTRNHSGSIESHRQDGAGSVSSLLLMLKAADNAFMDGSNQFPLGKPKMQSQKPLMVH